MRRLRQGRAGAPRLDHYGFGKCCFFFVPARHTFTLFIFVLFDDHEGITTLSPGGLLFEERMAAPPERHRLGLLRRRRAAQAARSSLLQVQGVGTRSEDTRHLSSFFLSVSSATPGCEGACCAVHSHTGQRAEPEQRTTSVDPSLGHGQHPRQRGTMTAMKEKFTPRSAAALHSRDELFSKHIEPEPAPEDPVDRATASDDEDDAPMPDLIDMPPAPASARPMSNLERCIALRLVATRRSHRPEKIALASYHIVPLLSHVSVVPCVVSLSCRVRWCPVQATRQ